MAGWPLLCESQSWKTMYDRLAFMLEEKLPQGTLRRGVSWQLTTACETTERFHPGRCYSGNMLRRCWAFVCTQAIGFQGISYRSFFEPSFSEGEGGNPGCREFTAFDNFGITFGSLPPMPRTHGLAMWHMLTCPRKAVAKTLATSQSSSATSL